MKMGSDLGKLHRRKYMVESQVKSFGAKAQELNRLASTPPADTRPETLDDGSDYRGLTALGNMTDALPQVTVGNTLGTTLFLGILGAGVGLITYSQYQSKTNLASMKPRLKRAAIYGAIGMGAAVAYQGATGAGQQTGWY